MKIRASFVSNSSSTSFIITNISDSQKSLIDFVKENPDLIDEFLNEYDWNTSDKINMQKMINDAQFREDKDFKPGESKIMMFGDEEGTALGQVFDYMLRSGGTSESFIWSFYEYNR
jgi:hypothetical protein